MYTSANNQEDLPVEFDPETFQLTVYREEDLILCGIAESADGVYDGTNVVPRVDRLEHTFTARPTKRIVNGLIKLSGQKIDEISELEEIHVRALVAFAKIKIIEACLDPA